jgi:hypothetical protein
MNILFKNIVTKGMTLLFATFLLNACIKDIGNYNYFDINEIIISGINDSDHPYTVGLGEYLTITPELTFSLGESHDTYKYEWHVMESGLPYASKGILSTEKNLNAQIGELITSSGNYRMLYCITNLTTGVRYDHQFSVVVQDKMLTGYIMLCEKDNNNFDIDLISLYLDTLKQYHNVLDIYQSELPRTDNKPLDIICYGDYISPEIDVPSTEKRYAIWVLTEQGTYRVQASNFHYQPSYDISALSIIPERLITTGKLVVEKLFSVSAHSNTSGKNYIYYNGNYYFYNWSPMGLLYYLPINAYSNLDAPYKTSPLIFNASAGAILFNETNNRFEFHKAGSTELTADAKNLFKTTRLTGGDYFDWEDQNYKLVYLGNRIATSGYAIVKNTASGKYEFLQMAISTLAVASQSGKSEFPAGVDLESIKHFAYHNTLPYLYCATEDKVYRVHTSTMGSFEDVTSQVLPAGHKISKMKNTAWRFPRANLIMVATYDPNKSVGENGEMAFYNVTDGTGALTLAKHPAAPTADGYQIDMKWTGFGKIINVDYRQP